MGWVIYVIRPVLLEQLFMINTDPKHQHTYDENGNMTCCSLEEKIYAQADASDLLHDHSKEGHSHDDHDHSGEGNFRAYLPSLISFLLLLLALSFDHLFKFDFFKGYLRLGWYMVAYIPVGWPVIKEAFESLRKGEIFTEFTLMCVATLGAFAIEEYPEAVAVMLFYSIGELFQSAAVNRAKSNIKAMLDVLPNVAHVVRKGKYVTVSPDKVKIGDKIQVKAGEKVPLDGLLISDKSSFNTASLTGESKPASIKKGEQVLAGMLNLDNVVEIIVTKKFSDSSLSRILEMVQNATSKKAPTELLIRKLAKIYTPIVFFLALALVVIPYFADANYLFKDWLYRALTFLVISCPCALVISIPLGYFGGIGAASRHGILFKGSNFLEMMTKVNTIVMDKTGTMTKGIFKVREIISVGMSETEFMRILSAIEQKSTHPIAKAIAAHEAENGSTPAATSVEEIPGHGLKGIVNGKTILAGNAKLLQKFNIPYPSEIDNLVESVVVVAIDDQYAGYVLVADEIKEDAVDAIQQMHANGIRQIVMLSGDKNAITQKVAAEIGVDNAFGDLLPENKVEHVEQLKKDPEKVIAFVGDGINDAPVLALSDVGIAMGAMGSDAAIEIADIVIQDDKPSKISTAIKIGKATRKIVIQNLVLAFTVKIIVLAFSTGGLATMWEAVFADVGVALLAILNAVRIQRMQF